MNQSERYYGRDFNDNPDSDEQNTSIRFIDETLAVSFNHPSVLYKESEDTGKVRGLYTIRDQEELLESFQAIHEVDPAVLPEVLQHLQDFRNDLNLNTVQATVLEYAISRLSEIVRPIIEGQEEVLFEEKWEPLTPPPHPRTSSQAVDIGWFKWLNKDTGNQF